MKKKTIIILATLLGIILLAPLPSGIKENLVVNKIENATNEKEEVAVTIDGVYYKFLILNDRFKGKFQVEGLDGVKEQVSMTFSKDREANMNLSKTNEPIYRIVQNNKLKEFAICIGEGNEEGSQVWGKDHGFTITTLDSIREVMEFTGI